MSETPSYSIAALFEDRSAAEAAVADLEMSGLNGESIHLVSQDAEPGSDGPVIPVAAAYTGGLSPAGLPSFAPGVGAGLLALNVGTTGLETIRTGIARGQALVAVEAGERTPIARTVLERNGGDILGG